MMDKATLAQKANEAGERIKYNHEFLKWDTDYSGKLYYSFWILFMGGFVLSLTLNDRFYLPNTHYIASLIRAFRVVAVVGSVLTFLMQSAAINSARLTGDIVTAVDRYRADLSRGDIDAAEAQLTDAEKYLKKRQGFDLAAMILTICAETCAAGFLILALIVTWNVLPVAAGK